MPPPSRRTCDVLVIGAGPAGASAAYWLAQAGADVLVVERKRFPREKTCGDGLTPRAVRQLEDMGLGEELSRHHRFVGLHTFGFGRDLRLVWPEHPSFGGVGYVVTRAELDQMVAERAVKAGARLWEGAEALRPLEPVPEGAAEAGTWRGPAGGALVADKASGASEEVRARCVVVADGANSRFGRGLGASRNRSYPLGMAIRGYFTSPRSDDPWIESHLDIRDGQGSVMPAYGWVFPLGDGRVNVGVGLLSTFNRWKQVNTSHLMDAFVAEIAGSWGISEESACGSPTGGKLPTGLSVGPRSGADWLVAGDAAGSINPFNGEGIAYAYETGRLAARVVGEALTAGDPAEALAGYGPALEDAYGVYYRVARGFVSVIGNPAAMRALARTGMRSRTLMEWALRIMSNTLRPDELGPAEAMYKGLAAVARRRSAGADSPSPAPV